MKKYFAAFLSRLAMFMEFFISIMLAVGIILLCLRLASSLIYIPDLDRYPNYEDLLEACFELIIGVELIRMMYYHTPDTVFEVLLFAIARQIIIDHSSPVNSLLGVIAIAILFATRKFLFSSFDETDKTVFRATQKVCQINRLFQLNIPSSDKDDTLLDVLLQKLDEDGTEVGTGACAYFSGLGLRVTKIKDGKITRIEVIRSIQ